MLPSRVVLFASLFAMIICIASCGSKQKSVENAAKDWCKTIRGSQVIPVYPIQEDIQPGDIYLVDTPIHAIKKFYEDKGYLPIDNHLDRMNGFAQDFNIYYQDEFYKGINAGIPYARSGVKSQTSSQSGSSGSGDKKEENINTLDACYKKPTQVEKLLCTIEALSETNNLPSTTPIAAFPTYSFTIDKSSSLNLGISLQGIPIGLAILNTREAMGQVIIRDAYCIGLPIAEVYRHLNNWARDANNRSLLVRYARGHSTKKEGNYLYLRVINKVFLARQFDISMIDTSKTGLGAAVGRRAAIEDQPSNIADQGAKPANEAPEAETPVNAAETAEGAAGAATGAAEVAVSKAQGAAGANGTAASEVPTATAQEGNLDKILLSALEGALERSMPGGQVTHISKTGHAVALRETFERPLVIGYHAFDVPFNTQGQLGLPVATRNYIENQTHVVSNDFWPVLDWNKAQNEINSMNCPCAKSILAETAKGLPPEFFGKFTNKDAIKCDDHDSLVKTRDFNLAIVRYTKSRRLQVEKIDQDRAQTVSNEVLDEVVYAYTSARNIILESQPMCIKSSDK